MHPIAHIFHIHQACRTHRRYFPLNIDGTVTREVLITRSFCNEKDSIFAVSNSSRLERYQQSSVTVSHLTADMLSNKRYTVRTSACNNYV